ncbi:4'-phosphopantetheinyl transferase superfamily protein [Amphibacillus indicireducens]|uniref:4'-phosphopantetheinyl transferase domain-containing protein n=1 Tax=Amphibacillus indicireducens TaxID=1076330 RepID=A0ABP7VDP7_9BACI
MICAIDKNKIGIDIEKMDDIDMAKYFLTKKEFNFLISITEEEKKISVFYDLWTLKESYVKYLGTGMLTSLESIKQLKSY